MGNYFERGGRLYDINTRTLVGFVDGAGNETLLPSITGVQNTGLTIGTRPLLPDAVVGVGVVNMAQTLFEGQPIGITRPVRSAGKMVANFATGIWTLGSGAGAVTQGVSGYDASGNVTGVRSRTGQSEMLQLVIGGGDNALNRLLISAPATNILTAALAGKIGLWVHVANQPGYSAPTAITFTAGPIAAATSATLTGNWANATGNYSTTFSNGDVRTVTLTNGATTATWSGGLSSGATANATAQGSAAGTLDIEMTTNGGRAYANAMVAGFNSNQLREGWNFLKFVMRDPVAYQSTAPTTEYHPFGISAACYGTGVDANIVANALTELRINVTNMAGATLTFDSVWTGFDTQAQIVLGCDAAGSDLLQYGAPTLLNYGWRAYTAIPGRVWVSGSTTISDWSSPAANARTLYDTYGWENINHSANHLANGTLTTAGAIDYEVSAVQAMYANAGILRGCEFYASPQSSSSRLAENTIKNRSFKLQRHARKWNVCVTPWGIDNPQHVGAIDFGNAAAGGISSTTGTTSGSVAGWQTFTKLQRFVDTLIAYGDTGFPFWHGITVLGDTGSGNDLTGDNLLITKSAFDRFMAYIKTKDDAGQLRVRDGVTGFYYGVGR